MIRRTLFAVAVLGAAAACPVVASAASAMPRTFSVKADRIAVDTVTKETVLTGHVEAVSEPVHLRTEFATRDEVGIMHLTEPTSVTTCTNHPGICHWSLRGDVKYLDGKYFEGRNVWLEFYELPIFWLPYVYYPLEGECALRVMPGYMSRWGAYVLTKYLYDIVGDSLHRDNTWWLHGNTRFDLRYENGVAFGENLYWNLGDYGRGEFKIYYAWDEDYDSCLSEESIVYGGRNRQSWGSMVERDRYMIELSHTWDITERDVFRLRGRLMSDSYFAGDFLRDGFFTIKNEWIGFQSNEIAWEHNESMYGAGLSVSGPLNKFIGGTARLPEVYLDLQPTPVFSLPVNYETENRIGYLTRQPAEYGRGDRLDPYAFNPGVWADYGAFRVDSYHRLTAPFRIADDFLSVVPRVGYRATGWSDTGKTDLGGYEPAHNAGSAFRSILEAGSTFAARGRGWLDDGWRHTIEPYLDFLAQKSWSGGMGDGTRAYVFDSLDASVMWEDQFAGRSRNLPYTYCGITPGLRNSLDTKEEGGVMRQLLDLDVYAAVQFNEADYEGYNDLHKLAEADSPNYGESSPYLMPGARIRWSPDRQISLAARAEYDTDNSKIALGDVGFRHEVSKNFSYYCTYSVRDFRWWDFSSTAYDPARMRNDDLNRAYYHLVKVGFTQQPLDWFAWSPFVNWDLREGEVDSVGSWFDYLTDCLGFRLLVEYSNEYTRIDGYRREDDFSVGFFIYLRALGADSMPFVN